MECNPISVQLSSLALVVKVAKIQGDPCIDF